MKRNDDDDDGAQPIRLVDHPATDPVVHEPVRPDRAENYGFRKYEGAKLYIPMAFIYVCTYVCIYVLTYVCVYICGRIYI